MRRRAPGALLAALLALCLALTGCAGTGGGDAAAGSAGVSEDSAAGTLRTAESGELEVTFLEAGKADAILLTTPESTVLVDCGEKGFGKTILAELAARGIEKIDVLIITHFDQDHVGGAAKVINNIAVGTVLQSNQPKDSEEYEKYIKALTNAQLEPVTVRETYSFVSGGVLYTVDPPARESYRDDSSNNSSLIVRVELGETSFLLTGDAETERLSEYLDESAEDCDVLKLPHHGQDEPLLEALLDAAAPAYAVITSSDEEKESEAVLALLEEKGVEVLLTREGTLRFTTDGKSLSAAQ